jgi:alpha-L-arabinofuranosidase
MVAHLKSVSGRIAFLAALLVGASQLLAAPAAIRIDLDKPGHTVSPLLYGIFFEDINCSSDGGLYAELVRNRNFEDSPKPDHWGVISGADAQVDMRIDSSQPASPKNIRSLRVNISRVGTGRAGVVNHGFWGIPVNKGQRYRLSLLARGADEFAGPLTASIEGEDGVVYGQAKLADLNPGWKSYELSLKVRNTDPHARLVLSTERAGTFWLDMVSLFPVKTWKNRPTGLRPDLAEMLVGLKPAFVRFPGGCWVEGDTMALAYRWKETVGSVAERRTQHNIWQYMATHGIGYHEYLQLCEDLHAEPLFVINCGMSHKEVVPMEKMGEFVQDALDAIEYANGPATSRWGGARARNGHRPPFHLKYIEIGNENGGPAYQERYALFHDAIKAKYPQVRLIANEWSSPPNNRPLDIVDEHYYSTPEFFISNAGKYDSYDRAGRKVYVGEYAVTQGCGQGDLRAAVGEAAFMTGLERNSDVVVMASYAPLFANLNYKKWNPDLINFDSFRVYGLPSYYVQKMFSENKGERVLPVSIDATAQEPAPGSGTFGVGTWRTAAEFKEMKVTRGDETLFDWDAGQGTRGWRFRDGDWVSSGGVLRQNSLAENVRAFAEDKSWSNYTYALKARKLAGDEGFLIPFLAKDENQKAWWNLGGWGNRKHAVEMDGAILNEVPGQIETGRWYDIRIEVNGARIKCYLDGRLVHELAAPRLKPLYASATLSPRELILKVVNVSTVAQETEIRLKGREAKGNGTAMVLASESPGEENSLDDPWRVAPVTQRITCRGSSLRHSFPGNSVSVIRLTLQ